MGHTVKQLEELRRRLSELPVPDDGEREVNKREAIAMLAGEIGKLQKKGYNFEMIAKALASYGLDMSVSTLKSYITKAKRTMKRRGGKPSMIPMQPTSPKTNEKKKSSLSNDHPQVTNTPPGMSARSSAFTPRNDSIDI